MAPDSQAQTRDSFTKEIVDLFHEMGKARGERTISAWMDLQLTLPQFKMLVVISKAESSTVGCIAEHLGVGEPTASYLVERLVQAELIERTEDPSDRRRARIRLSPAGAALLDKLTGPRNWLSDLIGDLDAEDLAALRQGLRAVAEKIRTMKQRT
jgi:DNA-binding MarR family transcriptional regulator